MSMKTELVKHKWATITQMFVDVSSEQREELDLLARVACNLYSLIQEHHLQPQSADEKQLLLVASPLLLAWATWLNDERNN